MNQRELPVPKKTSSEETMFSQRLRLTTAAGLFLTVALSAPAYSEDTLGLNAVDCGAGCAAINPATHFLPLVQGATFVINIAHLPPVPEEAMVDQRPVTCDPVDLRVDTVTAFGANGVIDVALGERVKLDPGGVTQIVRRVGAQKGRPGETMDLVACRIRVQSPSSRCSIVASGLYYPNDNASPIPYSLLPGSSQTLNTRQR